MFARMLRNPDGRRCRQDDTPNGLDFLTSPAMQPEWGGGTLEGIYRGARADGSTWTTGQGRQRVRSRTVRREQRRDDTLGGAFRYRSGVRYTRVSGGGGGGDKDCASHCEI